MSDEITDLHKAGEELLATARESSDGRSSRAVVHGDRMRAVLMALVNGTGLGSTMRRLRPPSRSSPGVPG